MHRLALAGLLPVLFAAPGGTQTPPVVTEAEFLSVLDDSHPAFAESAEALGVARARRMEVSTLENPSLAMAREDPEGPVRQTDWTLSWQLPRAARRPEIEAREHDVEAAESRLAHRFLTLRLAMREVYAEWALAGAREERLAARARRVEALAQRQAARAEHGESSGLEAHRLALAAAALRSRVTLAAAARENARARAAVWHPAMPADARPALPAVPAAPGIADPHPRMRAAEADLAAALLGREAAGRFVRAPELTLGWQRQEAGEGAIDGPVLGLAWSVPLLDRDRAETAAAEARVAGARARLERTRREVSAARAAARTVFQRLTEALGTVTTALDGSERTLDGAEAAFLHGEATLTDLLDTHRSVTEAELAVLDLHREALAAHRELERLAGAGTRTDDPSNPTPPESTP